MLENENGSYEYDEISMNVSKSSFAIYIWQADMTVKNVKTWGAIGNTYSIRGREG